MKLDCLDGPLAARVVPAPTHRWGVRGESDRLTDVMLCPPTHLAPVPCCSVTRDQLREGFAVSPLVADAQFRALRRTLEDEGVTCHEAPAAADLPDLCFMRDTAVMTPWGLVGLKPALGHRAPETDRVIDAIAALDIPILARIADGSIEGGDVCVARPGLLIIGRSGDRTDAAGAAALAAIFEQRGWTVLLCPFDPYFLHLDTMFCMLDDHRALACVDVLDAGFLAALAYHGIELLPVTLEESRRLGCNTVSLDGHRIVMAAGNDRIERQLADAGFQPIPVDVSQFSACGGGIHCLTLPLGRVSSLPIQHISNACP